MPELRSGNPHLSGRLPDLHFVRNIEMWLISKYSNRSKGWLDFFSQPFMLSQKKLLTLANNFKPIEFKSTNIIQINL